MLDICSTTPQCTARTHTLAPPTCPMVVNPQGPKAGGRRGQTRRGAAAAGRAKAEAGERAGGGVFQPPHTSTNPCAHAAVSCFGCTRLPTHAHPSAEMWLSAPACCDRRTPVQAHTSLLSPARRLACLPNRLLLNADATRAQLQSAAGAGHSGRSGGGAPPGVTLDVAGEQEVARVLEARSDYECLRVRARWVQRCAAGV